MLIQFENYFETQVSCTFYSITHSTVVPSTLCIFKMFIELVVSVHLS